VPDIVHVVDDDEAVRDSLRFMLEQEGLSVRTYADAHALLATELPPLGCVVTDFRMPEIDGLQLQSRLARQGVRLPVILMTAYGDISMAVRALKAGAADILEKPFEDRQLVAALKRAFVSVGEAAAHSAAGIAAAAKIALLTSREHEVLELLAKGKSTKEIGRTLGTSPRTIDVHRARVFQKLGAATLPDIVHLVLSARGEN
jgi:two-component system response regulator FixJ